MNTYQHFKGFEWLATEEFKERDGRLKHRKIGEVWGQAGPLASQLFEPVFCYCGRSGGFITRDTPVIYVCQRCWEMHGEPPLERVPGTDNL